MLEKEGTSRGSRDHSAPFLDCHRKDIKILIVFVVALIKSILLIKKYNIMDQKGKLLGSKSYIYHERIKSFHLFIAHQQICDVSNRQVGVDEVQ